MFYRSLSPIEQAHVVEAFTFELGKVYEQDIKERELTVLANVDTDLCEQVAAGLGLRVPRGGKPATDTTVSAALSQVVEAPGLITGRKVGVFVDAAADLAGVAKLRRALDKLGAEILVIASIGGELSRGAATETVDRTLLTTRSRIEFDALLVADGVVPTDDIKLLVLFQEAFRHCKTIGAWGSGDAVLEGAGIDIGAPGIVLGSAVTKRFNDELVAAVGLHRAWARAEFVMASD